MIDQRQPRAYLKAGSRIKAVFIIGFIGLVFLLPGLGQALAGAVQEVNTSRGGQTVDLNSLAVKGKITVVDFFSPYCPPCVRLAPLLEQLAQKRADLVVKKVNIQRPEVSGKIDWQAPVAKQLGLRSIPYFMIFDKKGKIAAQGGEATNQVMGMLKEAGLLKK